MSKSSFYKTTATPDEMVAVATSAANAATSATQAATSASNASTSETNAANSASTATTKASEASTSATNASNSATAAATSASSASTSASTATTQATTATTQATNATNSATSASNSASTATTQATNASNSATAAANSATAAANSATAAANSAASIGDLDSLSDVTISSVSANQFIKYSGSAFVNTTVSPTITLGGDLSGSLTLTNLTGGTLTATVADDSHNHTIANVDNLQTSLDAKAPLASPALTGNPTAPTQSASDNSTKIATTAYTDTAISNLVDSSPAALNTLNELAAALGDDANFSTTVTNSLATKAPLASPGLTGTPTAPTASGGTNTTQIATTAFVTSANSNKATKGFATAMAIAL